MRFNRREKSILDFLFILSLVAVFLVSSLLVIFFGAQIYSKTVESANTNFTLRTSVSYITEKIRQHDNADCVRVITEGGEPVLLLSEDLEDVTVETYLYAYEGYLKEISVKAGADFSYKYGQDIMEISSFNAEQVDEHLFHFELTDENGESVEFDVSTNTSQGGGDL